MNTEIKKNIRFEDEPNTDKDHLKVHLLLATIDIIGSVSNESPLHANQMNMAKWTMSSGQMKKTKFSIRILAKK